MTKPLLVLDTNVISEMMRQRPDPHVLDWLDAQPASSLFTTSITEAEIRAGVAMLPAGRRRTGLAAAADQLFELFGDRVLPFDSAAARAYAILVARRRAAGRPVAQADGQIAAITKSRNATVVTRNVEHFEDSAIDVIDPWLES